MVAVAVVAAAVAGAAIAVVVVGGGTSAAAPGITLVHANAPGKDPFTQSVATSSAGDVSSVGARVRGSLRTDPHTKTLVAAGTAPGLYGGSGDVHVCDAQKLVSFLDANPAKARAWASVFHLLPKDIASYVATLTPVVLTADTLVTNHGYRNGAATSLTSVLEAGTAVMVDRSGTPRVKCNCGNPLLPPVPINLASATLLGPRWNGYAPTRVTIIEAGHNVSNFTLTNVNTGATYVEPAGTDDAPSSGGRWVATEVSYSGYVPTTTIVTSRDGATWKPAGVVTGEAFSGLAFGDGKWIAVAQGDYDIGTGTHMLESTDLHRWVQVGTAPENLVGIGHTDGQWVAVGTWPAGVAVGGVDHATRAVYTSADGTSWTQLEEVPDGPDTGANMRGLVSVAHGGQGWTAIGIDETTPASGAAPTYQLSTLTSSDGSQWTQPAADAPAGDGRAAIANGGGTWAEAMTQTSGRGVLRTAANGVTWTAVAGTPFGAHPASALAHGTGTWLAVSAPAPTSPLSVPANAVSTVFTSQDLKRWKQSTQLQAEVTAVAYGGAATPSTTPASSPDASAGGQPPCTRQVLQDAFGHDPEDDMDTAILHSYDPPICADGWAAVHIGNQGMYPLVVFRAVGSTWTHPTDLSEKYPSDPFPPNTEGYLEHWHSLCADPQFPKALHPYACPGQ
jgi:hypothetical protein